MIYFMILSCSNMRYQFNYKNKYDFFKKVYSKDLFSNNYNYIFVCGNKEQNEEFIYNPDLNIVYVKCDDNYDSLPMKVYMGIKYILKNENIEGIFKLDDTSIINDFNVILDSLKNNSKIDYFGAIKEDNRKTKYYKLRHSRLKRFQYPEKYKNVVFPNSYFCHGCGYYLSLQSCRIILDNLKIIENNVLEDTCIGYILNCNNVFPVKIDNLDSTIIHKK